MLCLIMAFAIICRKCALHAIKVDTLPENSLLNRHNCSNCLAGGMHNYLNLPAYLFRKYSERSNDNANQGLHLARLRDTETEGNC